MEYIAKQWEMEFFHNLKGLREQQSEEIRYIERYFLLYAAPVLTGAQPSSLVCFHKRFRGAWNQCTDRLCETTGLCVTMLYENQDTFALLIYDRRKMAAIFRCPVAVELLKAHGYPHAASLPHMLACLKTRFCECSFPHEIGIFLGYPPKDVCAFIQKNGREYLCCRYWKVYHDEQSAIETFRCIDEAKARAIKLLTQNVPLNMAAQMLSATQTA